MDNQMPSSSGVALAGLSVALERDYKVASLRYFDAAGPIAADLRGYLGAALPGPLKAVKCSIAESSGDLILAWRSPTETILMTADGAAFEGVVARIANLGACGCLVDQTGGLWAWRVTGARARDLLLRLGSIASIPALGEACVSRVAELPVMALCVRAEEIILLVERVYSSHLLTWISETAADF
jgi:sarcosine oxidase gamma subunit